MIDGESNPGRCRSFARKSNSCSSAEDVSGVCGSDCEREENEGAIDFEREFERKSYDDDVDAEGVIGDAAGRDTCEIGPLQLGENIGRRGWTWLSCVKQAELLMPRFNPRPKFGVGLRLATKCSSRSALRTRAHICFHTSSDNRGPGSSALSPFMLEGDGGVGLG